MNPIPRVLVVDDDSFMRELLRRVFIEADIPVETFASANLLLDSADLRPPAVLLLDVKMPGMSGLELQTELHRRGIRLPVIFLTGSSDVPMVVEAMRNGAADFLEKPWKNDALIERVRESFDSMAAPPQQRDPAALAEYARRRRTLTPRELEVHKLMITGMTSKMMAFELGGSFRTIEAHRIHVMTKMGASNLAHLVRLAFEGERAV